MLGPTHNTKLYYHNEVEKVIDRLRPLSALTKIQLDMILLDKDVQNGGITVVEALRLRKSSRKGAGVEGISAGSYYRVLSQARRNVERSIFTLLLASKLEIVDPEEVARLLAVVRTSPPEMVPEDLDRFSSVLSSLVKRIVMS